MSLIEIIFSQPLVVASLVFVALLLLAAIGVAVGPGIYRKMKKRSAQRQAAREEKIARQQAKRKGKGRNRSAQPRRARPAEEAESGDNAEAVTAALPPAAAPEAAPVPVTPPAAEEPAAAAEAVSDIQDILDSVFVDEEANERFESLMRDVEVSSAEELRVLANRVAAELRARSQQV